MGSNMQKQATPCIIPEAPLVATGIEELAARDSGRLIIAEVSGVISYVDAKKITVKDEKEVVMKNGMAAISGVCGDCGTKVFKIIGKKK